MAWLTMPFPYPMKILTRNAWASLWRHIPEEFLFATMSSRGTEDEHIQWFNDRDDLPNIHIPIHKLDSSRYHLYFFKDELQAIPFMLAWN